MKLNAFITNLLELQKEGHGDKEVFYCHGASGDCGPLSHAFVETQEQEGGPSGQGPFDVEPGEKYISIYAGN